LDTRRVSRIIITALVFLPFLLNNRAAWEWDFLQRIENILYDLRVQLTMPGTPDERVVILDLDDRSINQVGQWPWPRDVIADLVVKTLDGYGAAVVGFDIAFPEPDRAKDREVLERLAAGALSDDPMFLSEYERISATLERDRILAEALQGREVVMGFVFQGRSDALDPVMLGQLPSPAIAEADNDTTIGYIDPMGFTANLSILQSAAITGGFFDNPSISQDGIFRQVPTLQIYQGDLYPSLALEVVRRYLGNPPIEFDFFSGADSDRGGLDLDWLRLGDLRIPVDEETNVLVPYRGPQRTIEYVSAIDVLEGTAQRYLLQDRIVLLGTSAAGLLDLRSTPTGENYPGVEVHANIISGILSGTIKHHPRFVQGIEIIGLLFIAVLVTWLLPRVSVLVGFAVGAVLIGLVMGGNFFLWAEADFYLPMAPPLAFTILLYFTHMLYGFLVESRNKRQLAEQFGHYVPPELVEEMDANPDLEFSMEGESRDMTVLFSDVRNFTTMSEGLTPKELTELMNAYLTPMTRVVQSRRGTIDKYIGDAIMAFWGAPLKDPDHAENAVYAAIEMQEALELLNVEFAARGWPKLAIGAGLSTGSMSVGNMGSEFRMAYTVLGDAVNLGSRLEGLTKEYGVSIIVSEETKLQSPSYAFMELDRVRVKGRAEPVAIFEPVMQRNRLSTDDKSRLLRHKQALAAYRKQDWDTAEREFFMLSQASNGKPLYDIYLERVNHFRKEPPPSSWDGVFTFTTK
jgi:adenylate cyclase